MFKVTAVMILISIIMVTGCNKSGESGEISIKKNISGKKTFSEESGDEGSNKNPDGKSDLMEITSAEVNSHIGDSVIVKGYIADVYLSGKAAYLNFENKFPKNTFSCTIFENKFSEFGDLTVFKNITAEVRGKITTYKNKPQIILTSADQIRILPQ